MHNWKNLLKLLASVTAVQIIGFVLLPFFSRLYSKADFGILGMLMSVVGLLTPLASARYDQAIFVAKEGSRLRLLRVLALSINLALTAILIILCLLAEHWLVGTNYEVAIPYLFIIPLTVFFAGVLSVLSAGANAKGAYGTISLASLVQGYVNNGLKVVCGWAHMGAWGFGVAFNVGMAIACAILGYQQRKDWFVGVTKRRLSIVARHYKGFPLYTTWMITIAMLIVNILAMLLPNFYSTEDIGIITMLYMISRRPVQVYSEATGRIYARRLVEATESGASFRRDINKVFLRLLIISIVAAILSPWLAEPLVDLVLGSGWDVLGKIIPWIIPFLFMEALNYIFCFIPDVIKKQKEYAVIQAVRLIAEIAFIFSVAPLVPFELFIRAYFIFAALEYGLIFLWFYRLIVRYEEMKKPQNVLTHE